MLEVYVDDRVETRHPEQNITKEDAIAAWNHAIRSRPRIDKSPGDYIAIGTDDKGRAMELAAVRNREGDWLIYHAFIPPQPNALRSLGFRTKKGKERG